MGALSKLNLIPPQNFAFNLTKYAHKYVSILFEMYVIEHLGWTSIPREFDNKFCRSFQFNHQNCFSIHEILSFKRAIFNFQCNAKHWNILPNFPCFNMLMREHNFMPHLYFTITTMWRNLTGCDKYWRFFVQNKMYLERLYVSTPTYLDVSHNLLRCTWARNPALKSITLHNFMGWEYKNNANYQQNLSTVI